VRLLLVSGRPLGEPIACASHRDEQSGLVAFASTTWHFHQTRVRAEHRMSSIIHSPDLRSRAAALLRLRSLEESSSVTPYGITCSVVSGEVVRECEWCDQPPAEHIERWQTPSNGGMVVLGGAQSTGGKSYAGWRDQHQPWRLIERWWSSIERRRGPLGGAAAQVERPRGWCGRAQSGASGAAVAGTLPVHCRRQSAANAHSFLWPGCAMESGIRYTSVVMMATACPGDG